MKFNPAPPMELVPAVEHYGRSSLVRVDSSAVPGPPEGGRTSEELRQRVYTVRGDRERLLEAMVRVSAERGYEAASVADVEARAGLEQGAFELHFNDKEECFLAAYQATSDVLVALTSAAFEAAGERPWAERVTVALRAMVELLAAETEVARMAVVEVTAIPGDARVRSRELLDRFIPFLEQGREVGEQGAELPAETARFAIGGASSLIFDELRAGRGTELEAILPDLVFAVTMPYLGVAAAEAEMRKLST